MKYYSVLLISLSCVAVHHPAQIMSQTNSECLMFHGGVFHRPVQWYDDECHRFRCEVRNGKEVLNVTRCIKLQFPNNAIHCRSFNEHNKEEHYPKCCPRLKCIVVEHGLKYIVQMGQPEETFQKISLSSQDLTDAYEDFEYEAMSARHGTATKNIEDRDPSAISEVSPDVLGSRDYGVLFEEPASGKSPEVKLKAGPPQYYVVEEPSPRPSTLLEWVLWPLRGMFSSKIEVLGVTRFSLNTSFVKNYWDWSYFNFFTDI